MRTNIVIDDQLIKKAFQLTKIKTKRELVDQALTLLISVKQQQKLKQFKGKLKWEGDLEKMRLDQD